MEQTALEIALESGLYALGSKLRERKYYEDTLLAASVDDIEFPYKVISKVKEAEKNGWSKILKDLLFDPPKLDFFQKRGWFDYSEDACNLNGVFYLAGGTFFYNYVTCFLNPFVISNRNYPMLEDVIKYYKREK